MKDKLLEVTKAHLESVYQIRKRVARYSGSQIQAGSLLADMRAVAATWFDQVRSSLESANFATVGAGSEIFDRLLRQSKMKPGKSGVLEVLDEASGFYRDIIHVIETTSFAVADGLSIAPFVEGLHGDEVEYLDEAQRCLTVNGLRACVVLGWCAAIARIHRKIDEIGYDVFTRATIAMHAKTTGRFKWFKKQYVIESRSDLQMVFDTDLLLVLEFLELIDNNQHQRLRHCFELRNNSAHPGLAPIKGPNLYSFYSDISEIVLKNPKFRVSPLP